MQPTCKWRHMYRINLNISGRQKAWPTCIEASDRWGLHCIISEVQHYLVKRHIILCADLLHFIVLTIFSSTTHPAIMVHLAWDSQPPQATTLYSLHPRIVPDITSILQLTHYSSVTPQLNTSPLNPRSTSKANLLPSPKMKLKLLTTNPSSNCACNC